jgi:hypothetical protein
MRNKFTDLIQSGVASFNYVRLAGETPEQDPVCRAYNNIFSIPTDTHMSCIDGDTRVITGHMIATEDWGAFMNSCHWGAINFKTSGFWCLSDFLYLHNLEGQISTLNGDVVFLVTPRVKAEENIPAPQSVVTMESQIPLPLTSITNSGNVHHVLECFGYNIDEVVKKLNESTWIKGSNWVPTKNGIVGMVGDTIYKMNMVDEAHEYHRYSMDTREFTDSRGNEFIKIQVFDCYFDRLYTALIDTSTGGVTGDYSYPKFMEKFLDDLNDKIKKFDWTKDLECPMAYTITMPNPHSKDGWKLNRYPGYEIFTGVTSIGQLKKRTR